MINYVFKLIGVSLALVLIQSSLAISSGFQLVGTWQNSAGPSNTSPAYTQQLTFNSNGSFYYVMSVPPSNGKAGGTTKWSGYYEPTGSSSWNAEYENFAACDTSGYCSSCPGNGYACSIAASMGVSPGTTRSGSFTQRGNSIVIGTDGATWHRVH